MLSKALPTMRTLAASINLCRRVMRDVAGSCSLIVMVNATKESNTVSAVARRDSMAVGGSRKDVQDSTVSMTIGTTKLSK